MNKLSEKPICFAVKSSELRHGWLPVDQLKHNPAAKKKFSQWRKTTAIEQYERRIRQWLNRLGNKSDIKIRLANNKTINYVLHKIESLRRK